MRQKGLAECGLGEPEGLGKHPQIILAISSRSGFGAIPSNSTTTGLSGRARLRWIVACPSSKIIKLETLRANYAPPGCRKVVPGERIELPTNGLQNRCSTAELTRLINNLAIQDRAIATGFPPARSAAAIGGSAGDRRSAPFLERLKRATLQHPSWAGQHIGFQPFPTI